MNNNIMLHRCTAEPSSMKRALHWACAYIHKLACDGKSCRSRCDLHVLRIDWVPCWNLDRPTTLILTLAQLRVLTVSLAYFTYDSICCELIEHDLPNFL